MPLILLSMFAVQSGLVPGDSLPDFELLDQDGNKVNAQSFAGQAVVIFFYPKDDTPGCTKEVCAFRDSYDRFVQAGVEVVGISSDTVTSHQEFANNYGVQFPLLSDPDNVARKLFRVRGNALGLIAGRETFVFDNTGVLVHKFRSQLRFEEHVEQSLKALGIEE